MMILLLFSLMGSLIKGSLIGWGQEELDILHMKVIKNFEIKKAKDFFEILLKCLW